MIKAAVLDDFRSAYDIGKSKKAEELSENPVLDVIKQLAEDKRITRFDEDFPLAVDLLTGTLADVNRLRESEAEIDLIITHFSRKKAFLHEKAEQFIQDRYDQGITEEGDFKIVPIEKKTNRKVDRETLVSQFKPKYDLLLANKIEELQESYTPTIKEVEVVFGKKANQVLIPGSVTVIGYDIELISPMPEKASAGVEL